MKYCDTCKFHIEYYDIISGREYFDGCTCKNDQVNWKIHSLACHHEKFLEDRVECEFYEKGKNEKIIDI